MNQNNRNTAKRIFVTRAGLPLSITLDWPFHRSTSGADFWVLHGNIHLENTEGLHAPVSVNMTLVLKEVLPSLERADAEGPVINALRKEVDQQQIEFLKSGKLLPVSFSSRHYDFKHGRWAFGHATEEQIRELILRTVYWQQFVVGTSAPVADPVDAQYLDTTREQMLESARRLASEGLIKLDGEDASSAESLSKQAAQIAADMKTALEALQKKHEFERG
jgi:hypothetical protein